MLDRILTLSFLGALLCTPSLAQVRPMALPSEVVIPKDVDLG